MEAEPRAVLATLVEQAPASAARAYGHIPALRKAIGRPIDEIDAQLAAIARVHGTSLATRNIRGFKHCGIHLIDPWN